MRHEPSVFGTARRGAVVALAVCAWLATAGAARAQGSAIYTCLDDKGRRITSDRPIAECASREQQQLNRDGSVRRTVPPVPTAEERAEQELRERRAAEVRAQQADAVRQDRTLMQRYRTPEDHQRARAAALDAARSAVAATDERLAGLAQERKQYAQEAEFYRGRALHPSCSKASTLSRRRWPRSARWRKTSAPSSTASTGSTTSSSSGSSSCGQAPRRDRWVRQPPCARPRQPPLPPGPRRRRRPRRRHRRRHHR
ncbi:MAG: DUF4124 domain-containing protein, partial [Rubrivivax sp.]